MPNLRIKNTIPNITTGEDIPTLRVSSYQSGVLAQGSTSTLLGGMPWGILLAITRSDDVDIVSEPTLREGSRPNVRIK